METLKDRLREVAFDATTKEYLGIVALMKAEANRGYMSMFLIEPSDALVERLREEELDVVLTSKLGMPRRYIVSW